MEEGENDTAVDQVKPSQTNSEVGEIFEKRTLPFVLALVMEGWPDWSLVVPQVEARVLVFCDAEEVDGVPVTGERLPLESVWNHGVLSETNCCVLLSGSVGFVDRFLTRIAEGISVVAAVPHRRRESKVEERLRWRVLRHQDVGGVTTMRCSLGFPREWPEFHLRDHVQRRVKHVIVHSQRPRYLRRDADAKALKSVDDLLDYRLLDAEFALPLRTRKGEVPGRRVLTAGEIGAAFDLPLTVAEELEKRGLESEFGRRALSGCPSKFLAEGLDHALACLTGHVNPYDVVETHEVPTPRVRLRVSDGPKPAAEAALPPWAKVCSDNAKAAKADEAKPNIPMWDLRVQARRPDLSPEFLAQFREMLMVGWRRRCYLSFRRHMQTAYGAGWANRLSAARWHARRAEAPSRDPESSELSKVGKELVRDGDQGADVLEQIFGGCGARRGGSYWDWDAGSALLFWRFHPEERKNTRDGTKVFIKGKLPRYRVPQRIPRTPAQAQQLKDKLWRVRERGYITPGPVVSLTNVFAVPKVVDEAGAVLDVRPVYDATKSGLNEAVWAPSFWLPSTDTLFRMMDFDTWLGDIDLGEMFLNFPLDPRLQPYAGVDITQFCSEEERRGRRVVWERWNRTLMGFGPSPYTAIREELCGEEIVRGDRRDPENIFRWDRIRLNLPGSELYDPLLPWVSKVFSEALKDGATVERIACDFVTFVDDIRAAGYSLEATWQAVRRIASMLNYLGIQDAPRKRRSPLKTEAGAWTGALQRVYECAIVALTSQQKWDKAKRIIKEMLERVQEGSPLSLKALLKERGFLVHLSMTYPLMVPYLKGLHLTVDSWREGRDEEGWRMARKELEAFLAARGDETADLIPIDPKAPQEVQAVPRLERDLLSLVELTREELPAERIVRAKTVVHIVYGFADASGTGFGSTTVKLKALGRLRKIGEAVSVGHNKLRYRIGVWGKDAEGGSSNYRELRNVVEAVESEEAAGNLVDAQIFMCTDNVVAEAAIYNGTSSDPTLYDLVLRLKKVEMRSGCQFLVSHVAGKRMIYQGTDGVSRGNLAEGVMAGIPMAEFLPFHLSAVDRSSGLVAWVESWLGKESELLSPEGWFERGHDFDGGRKNCDGVWLPDLRAGTFIWAPPPAAADAALEELRKARHKRQKSTHVVVVPRLMTPKWRKQLHKACDCVFEMPAGCGDAWPTEMFEPCLIGVCFPFLSHRPWQLRGSPRLLALERRVRGLWEDGDAAVAADLCQFLNKTRKFRSMPEDVVRKMLYV